MGAATRRSVALALTLGMGLVAGLVVGRAGYGPSAGAQTADCAPSQTVPDSALTKLAAMDRKLDQVIDDYQRGEIDRRQMEKRVDTIIGLKLDLMDLFPPVFGYTFKSLYSPLRRIDNNLIDAPVDALTEGKKAALNDLESARSVKKQLESLLRSSPCGTSPSPT